MDKDFEMVLGAPTPEENEEPRSEALYTALSRNDFNAVIKILSDAGSGKWGTILPKKDFRVIDASKNWRQFSVHMSSDRETKELKILEKIESGTDKSDTQFIQRVSVQESSGIPAQPETPGDTYQEQN